MWLTDTHTSNMFKSEIHIFGF